MARPVLPTDFKDDILAESMSGKRRYRIIQNTDGTVSLDDVTDYEQVGSTFGAKQVNDMSSAVNSIEDVKAANNCTTTEPGFVLDARQGKTLMDKSNELSRDLGGIAFAQDADGNWGYKIGGADPVIPFKSISSLKMIFETGYNFSTMGNPNILTFEAPETGTFFLLIHVSGRTNDSRHDHNFGSMEISGCDAAQIFHTFKNTHQTGSYPYAGATVMRGYIVKLNKGADITITSTLSTPFNYANAMVFSL